MEIALRETARSNCFPASNLSLAIQSGVHMSKKSLWNDEYGVIMSAEIVLIGTILVLGMIVGLVELQFAVVFELNDLSSAIGNLDQSYSTSGLEATRAMGKRRLERTVHPIPTGLILVIATTA